MKREIALEIRRDNRITVASGIHRIDSLHTSVETDNQEVQVETQS